MLLGGLTQPCHLTAVGFLVIAKIDGIGVGNIGEHAAFYRLDNVVNVLLQQPCVLGVSP